MPSLARSLFSFIFDREYQGCELVCPREMAHPGVKLLLGPRCQCVWRYGGPGPRGPGARVFASPAPWSCHPRAEFAAGEQFMDPVDVAPRVMRISSQDANRISAGEHNCFRVHFPSCNFSANILANLENFHAPLQACAGFVDQLRDEIEEYFGSVGESSHITRLRYLMTSCLHLSGQIKFMA